jgi:hypothetical protein
LKLGVAAERIGQTPAIFPAWNFGGAELRQMLGRELRVQQCEAAAHQARHQMNQRDLAGVAGGGEHALAEERAFQCNAV